MVLYKITSKTPEELQQSYKEELRSYKRFLPTGVCVRCKRSRHIYRHEMCNSCWIITRRQKSPELQEKHRQKQNASNRKRKQRVINNLGGMCACCGESSIEFLVVDHIHGGGNQHRKSLRADGGSHNGSSYYKVIEEEGLPPDKYRVLCANCNTSYGLYGYCPHQKESE